MSIDISKLTSDKHNKFFLEVISNEINNESSKHSYIVDNFSMEARFKINKNPIANKRP